MAKNIMNRQAWPVKITEDVRHRASEPRAARDVLPSAQSEEYQKFLKGGTEDDTPPLI